MDHKKVVFLLNLLISKSISQSGIKEPADFILYYRLDENTAEQVMDEVSKIANEVNGGSTITFSDALTRIGKFHRFGTGTGGPTIFISDAFKVWAPDTWEQIKNT